MNTFILVRGGGDLASGIALRLFRAGYPLVIAELPEPLAVRRLVSFSEAVHNGFTIVENVTARLTTPEEILSILDKNEIPVLIDPEAEILNRLFFSAMVDARMLKSPPHPLGKRVSLNIGIGPGFTAGHDCDVIIETRRGHTMGRVYYTGTTLPDSGQPDGNPRRVLRADSAGTLISHAIIGDHVEEGQLIAEVQGKDASSKILSPFKGVLRGLLRDETTVTQGLKLGDVDPRDDPALCRLVSDKALAVGGAVLEALLAARQFPNN